MTKRIYVGPDHHLDYKTVAEIASNPKIQVLISPRAKKKVIASRKVVEKMVRDKKVVYGVTTGFGSFKDKTISSKDVAELQRNLIRSHSVGVGPYLSKEAVRAAMLVRLNSLLRGYSGVRLEFLELLCQVLNKNVVPVVPSQGSVGSSGDLAPLSHIGLVLMGEGMAWYKDKMMSGGEALRRAGLKPTEFQAKEGLAFNNGTSVMTGIAALNLNRTMRLLWLADIGCALTAEAICAIKGAFEKIVHQIRPHPGQQKSAENIRHLVFGSKLINSMPKRVQDAYSIRCAPQVHGAVRDAVAYVEQVVDRELNSTTDNPLIFQRPGRAISGGNFHGEPIAIAMDTLAIALSELANISERRTAKLMDASASEGLPMFLIDPKKGGLHNGLMMVQYTAAALVSENKILAHPASVDSIPTSANQEDHVSMGTIAARKAFEVLKNVENVLAIEFLSATQAIDFRGPRKLGRGTYKVYRLIRKHTPFISSDRELAKDIAKIRETITDSKNFAELKLR